MTMDKVATAIVFLSGAMMALIYYVRLMVDFKSLKKPKHGVGVEELEAIRRYLPVIDRVIFYKEKIAIDNQKIILPNATTLILYDFKKMGEIEKLAYYSVALMEEHYELLTELSKVVDDNFQAKVPTMCDIVRLFYQEKTDSTL